MGRAACKRVMGSDGMEIVQAFDPVCVGQDSGTLASGTPNGIAIQSPAELSTLDADVAIDFSLADSVVANSKAAADANCDMIIGTTGLSEKQVENIRSNLKGHGLIISPNMSVGVNVFWQLIESAAKKLPEYDVEIIEAHHKFKKDAPSGTALRALKIVKDAKGTDGEAIFGRFGESLRKDGEIGMHSIRAADIVGEHSVIFATEGERFEVRHMAHTRESFATGIPSAVTFIHGRKGVFDTLDALGLS